MKKFIATLAVVLFTVVLTSYNNTGDDQIDGDNNSTQMQEPGIPVLTTKTTDL
jgi:hypothetical protein